jgi:phospholipid transport system transporter-binding protein
VSGAQAAAVASGAPIARAFEIQADSGGHFTARGLLTFATARQAWERGLAALNAASARELTVDCSGITVADSAGLAVLLDWLGALRREGRQLRYRHLPESLLAIAAISDLAELLRNGAAA